MDSQVARLIWPPSTPVICGAAAVGITFFFFIRSTQKTTSSQLSLCDKLSLVMGILKFRFTWHQHTSEKPAHDSLREAGEPHIDASLLEAVKANPKFMTPACVAQKIPDGATVCTCGFPVSERCTPFTFAVKERFQAQQLPQKLTWISVGAQGARGRAPGSVEELAAPGLLKRFISGHLETVKSLQKAAAKGTLELYNVPQGTLAQLVEGQARGEAELATTVGLGTYFDPSSNPDATPSYCGKINRHDCTLDLVRSGELDDGSKALVYTIPKIDVTMFNSRYADTDGNVYLDENTTLTETTDAVQAAKNHRGLVFASVQTVVSSEEAKKKNVPGSLVIPAANVDGIVITNVGISVDTMGARAPMQLARRDGSSVDVAKTWNQLRFLNRFLKLTPRRTEADVILGRVAAKYYVRTFDSAPSNVEDRIGSIGVGLPEEVSHNMFNEDVCAKKNITLTTETGTIGGLPAMGMFFGMAIAPMRLVSSGSIFSMWKKHLHTACLGAVDVDELGNVNVSRRGPHISDVVGSGGFPNLVDSARHIVFVCSWAAHAHYTVDKKTGHLKILRAGKPKFLKNVGEITFCGRVALDLGKTVVYCTHVGVFQLTPRGLELIEVVPGVDVEKDILSFSKARIHVSESLRVVSPSVMNGEEYTLL